MTNGNDVRIVVDMDNRTATGSAAAVRSAKTVGDAAAVADKQLRDMGARLDEANVKARRLAEAEERAAAKTRDMMEKLVGLRRELASNGDASGALGRKIERLAIDTRSAANAADDYRRAGGRAAEAAREQARAYDRVADNARQAARAVALLGASAALSPGRKAEGYGGNHRWLSGLLGIGMTGAEGGLKGIGAGVGAIGSIGQAAGPYGMLAGITAGAVAAPLAGSLIGGAAGGAALAAGGAAGAGLGLAGAWANDPDGYAAKWAESTDKIKKRWLDSSAAFSNELDTGLKIADRTLTALPVERVLALSQSFVEPLAQGAGGGLTALADGFADSLEKVQPVIDAVGPALANLGAAGGDAFRMISEGADGGADALGDLVDGIGYAVRATGLLVLGFELAYEKIRNFEKANSDFVSKTRIIGPVVDNFKESIFGIDKTSIGAARALDKAGDATTNAGGRLAGFAADAARAAAETMGLNDALTENRNLMMSLGDATFAVNQGWLDLDKGLKDGKRTLDQTTQAGLDNTKNIEDQIGALERQRQQAIKTAGDNADAINAANAAYDAGIERIRATALALGFTAEKTDELIAAYAGVPPGVTTNIETPGMPGALSDSASLGARLNQIDRTYIAHIQVTGLGQVLADAARARAALATIGGGLGNSGNPGLRTGGIPHAAAGGGQSGLTMTSEEGPEFLRLPTGTMVYPTSNTRQMQTMAGWGGGGGGQLVIGSDGSRIGDALIEIIAIAMQAKGGRPEQLGIKIQGR